MSIFEEIADFCNSLDKRGKNVDPIHITRSNRFKNRSNTFFKRTVIDDLSWEKWLDEEDDKQVIPREMYDHPVVLDTIVSCIIPPVQNKIADITNCTVMELSGIILYVLFFEGKAMLYKLRNNSKNVTRLNEKETETALRLIKSKIDSTDKFDNALYQCAYDVTRDLFTIVDVLMFDNEYLNYNHQTRYGIVPSYFKDLKYTVPIENSNLVIYKMVFLPSLDNDNYQLFVKQRNCCDVVVKKVEFKEVICVAQVKKIFENKTFKNFKDKSFLQLLRAFISEGKYRDLIEKKYQDEQVNVQMILDDPEDKHNQNKIRYILSVLLDDEEFKTAACKIADLEENNHWYSVHFLLASLNPENNKFEAVKYTPIINIPIILSSCEGASEKLSHDWESNITNKLKNKNEDCGIRYLKNIKFLFTSNGKIEAVKSELEIEDIDEIRNDSKINWQKVATVNSNKMEKTGLKEMFDFMRTSIPVKHSAELGESLNMLERHFKNTNLWLGQKRKAFSYSAGNSKKAKK